jgi:NAD(P)-dependent dehydrogenase (short-subunit alcohol dehydrogenase family)
MPSGEARTAIVTGGNAGLGLETVRALAVTGAYSHIIAASRRPDAARQAVSDIDAHGATIEVAPLDLASLDSIRAFPAALDALGAPPVGALICNAGVQIVDGTRFTADGFEETFAVNVLGHFLLTRLLLDRLTPNARVIFVSSGTHDPSQRTGMPAPRYTGAADLAAGRGFGDADGGTLGRIRYTTSKLCDVYLAYEFARRYPADRTGVPSLVASAMDPGLMAGSGLARDWGPLTRFAWNHVLPHLGRVIKGSMTTQSSGLNAARLATEDSFAGTSGIYYVGATPSQSSELSYDRSNATDLWTTCATLSGIDP